LTFTTPDGTQVVVDDSGDAMLGVRLSPGLTDQSTTNTILGDRNADKRDSLTGTAVNDRIDAGADIDVVLGGLGADRINGGAGRDRLDGEVGDDIVEGGSEADILEGGAGRDRLFADVASTLDPLVALRTALAATASPSGSLGDWLSGNDEDDLLIGALGNDGLSGGQGSDVLVGGAGDDSLLGDSDIAPTDGSWSYADTESGGVTTRTFSGTDGGAMDPAGGAADSLYGGSGADFAFGGRGDDAIYGGDGNDFLQGDADSDVLSGGNGSDRLAGDGSATTTGADQGNDSLDGGAGDDVLTGGGGGDDLLGGAGDDTLVGDDVPERVAIEFHGSDTLDGGDGDDVISGGWGSDEILGGSGNDRIAGDLVDVAGGARDNIDAGSGDDQVDAGAGDDRVVGGEGADTIDGGDGHDEIAGNDGNDVLTGAGGDDLLEGGADDDQLAGGDGLDILDGGEGDDALAGGMGDDDVLGATGNDRLHGEAGNDRLSGEDGDDWLDGGGGNDDLHGGAGTDALSGGDGDDILDGAGGRDLLMGGGGIDRYVLANDGQPDFLAEIEAIDTIVIPDGISADALDFQRASDEFGNAGHLAIFAGNSLLAIALDCPDGSRPAIRLAGGTTIATSTIDAAIARHPTLMVPITLPSYRGGGSSSADSMRSAGGDSWLDGGSGDDTLTGGKSADALDGGDGADRLTGGEGEDTLTGGAGADVLDGGTGADVLDGGDGDDLLAAGVGDDDLAGGAGNDTLAGDQGADRLRGGDGVDIVDGGVGRDNLSGDAGDDVVYGGEGNDELDGGIGNDTLSAGDGNDLLNGGSGDDVLDGGNGDDTFVVGNGGIDRIRDASGTSMVRFASGVTLASISLARGATGTADEFALIVDFGAGNRTIVEDGLRGGPARYVFDDGTSLSRAELLDRRLASAVTLAGDASHRLIAGGAANDILSAGTAAPVDLRGGSGNDTITGSASADRLDGDAGDDQLSGGDGNDLLTGGFGNDSIGGGAGSDTLFAGDGNDTLVGGDGNDHLVGEIGDDTFVLDAGNDIAIGGVGDDTYRFGPGSGYDVVVDAEGANRIRYAAGIAATSIAFRTNGPDLLAVLADGSRLLMPYAFGAPEGFVPTRIDGFEFDGETLTLAQAQARATPFLAGDTKPVSIVVPAIGTAGDDTASGAIVWGLSGNDHLTGQRQIGGAGDDTLENGGTFVFGRGAGHDTVQVWNSVGATTVDKLNRWIEMESGIVAPDLHFEIDEHDLVVTIRDTGDSIRVFDHFERFGDFPTFDYSSAVAGVRFADGTTMGFAAIADEVSIGSDGDDRLGSVTVLLDTIRAGDGDDVVTLQETNAFVYGGDGNDTLSADPYLPSDASMLFGDAGDDVLTAGSANGAHTELYGGEGNDRLIGHPGAILDGGRGDDRHELWGGATGGPIGVVFARGGGSDSISPGAGDFDSLGNLSFDIRLGEIAYRDLLVERDGEDLVLRIRDSQDRIAVPDFFAAGAGRAGMRQLSIVQVGTGFVYANSPSAETIASRAQVVTATAQVWTGSDISDVHVGAGGADSFDGGAGNDELDGMSGDDTLRGGGGDDVLFGRSGDDTIEGGDGGDQLTGGRGDDVLRGGAGDDRIDDTFGDNAAEGGDGNDVVLLRGTRGMARGGAGDDTAAASVGDHLLLGEDGNDDLIAWSGTVTLDGGAGNDNLTIDAAASATVLFGQGGGTDDAWINQFRADAIDEIRLGAGIESGDVGVRRDGGDLVLSIAGTTDSLRVHSGFSGNQSAVTKITLTDGGALDASAILALARLGSTLDDWLVGTPGNETLSGLDGNDRLDGDAGNDLLDGGPGADALNGGKGDDVYVVDDAADAVVELAGEGNDEIRTSVTRTLPANVERIRLTGSADIDAYGSSGNDDVVGNAGNNRLDGGMGTDFLMGGAGDDVYVLADGGDTILEIANEGNDTVYATFTATLAANVENLFLTASVAVDGTGNALDNALTGGSGVNVLTGLAGNDTLDGSGGADRLVGGSGNDTYVVDHAGDIVVELPSEGIDVVRAAMSFILPSDVENLVLLEFGAINATGNSAANVLTGNASANVLDGKSGVDTMSGGKGNDTYVVDAASDVVTELATEGSDLVQASVGYTLGANVENLTLTGTAAINGTGNALANTLLGNIGANQLDGAAGNDTMRGGAGDDVYVVDAVGDVVVENTSEGVDTVRASISTTLANNVENLVLIGTSAINATGNALANMLAGNIANNLLDGKAGADAMAGGAGNDTYVVDAVGDSVTESVGEGTDIVQSSITWALAANVENLTLTGTAALNGTGNALANTLVGNAGANLLDGGTGADTLRGGAGNDTYVVDATTDVVAENSNEGLDVVQSSVTWTLGTNVENLTLTGTGAVNGSGNTLANTLVGNVANNLLNGGAGADTMRGGAGNDTYVVDSTADVITEAANEGADLVQASVTWTLGANVEELTITGVGVVDGLGNALSNSLVGNAAANVLSGLDGNDMSWGAAGNDTLNGGNGNDALQAGDGNDSITDAAGNNLLDGGLGTDTLTGAAGREFFVGGKGDDTISAGSGADVFAFNKGDGKDTLAATTGSDDTLSLGGGIRYADLGMRKIGNDLVLDAGSDQVTLKDWYVATTNHRIGKLQLVTDASADYLASSTDPTRNRRVARFDFNAIATAFDAARTGDPTLTRWTIATALAGTFIAGSDTAALGGDLAYQYGHGGSLAGIGFDAAGTILGDANFALNPQAFLPPATLGAGPRLLR
jgi:Ca2+-binding RTX toxin-like protein